jgi:hypothetical protein
MNARRKVALAMSLGLGIACQTTRGERTASVPTTTEAGQEQQETTAQRELEEERAGDLVFTGTVSDVYDDTVFVVNELGRTELIQVVPETDVIVSGREAQLSEIQEGQEIRASYEEREGRNVAVRITAGEPGTMQQREPSTIEEPAAPRPEEGATESGTPAPPAPER